MLGRLGAPGQPGDWQRSHKFGQAIALIRRQIQPWRACNLLPRGGAAHVGTRALQSPKFWLELALGA